MTPGKSRALESRRSTKKENIGWAGKNSMEDDQQSSLLITEKAVVEEHDQCILWHGTWWWQCFSDLFKTGNTAQHIQHCYVSTRIYVGLHRYHPNNS